MTEKSYLWTTGGAGDGANTYTRADWARILKIAGACGGHEGVGPGYLNAMSGTVPGANTVNINTGGAIVDGKPYDNDAVVAVNIPSAVGGGNTRIDRIVLRADWTAQTVRVTRIAGTDAASPTVPAITQNIGTLYDIKLYQALVDTGGTVTLTDERDLAYIETAEIKDNNVTDAKLRDSAALSVVGRASNSSGDPADIAAGSNEQVLMRTGNALVWQQVNTAQIANDAVDDTKVGNRVPQFYRRQGGSATDWTVAGTTSQTPTAVRWEAGVTSMSFSASQVAELNAITFPQAFSQKPLVWAFIINHGGLPSDASGVFALNGITITTAGFELEARRAVHNSNAVSLTIAWFAVGAE